MTTLVLDPFSGASGDMFLGLLVDLGVAPAAIEAELRTLPLGGWHIDWQAESRKGVRGTRAVVSVPPEHHHRTWADIDRLLVESRLSPAVCSLAQRIFERLAVAEGKVHGLPPQDVHFHEVGALDSILDIVGTAAGLVRLGVKQIVCGPLPLGAGMVETAHGRYPLPAPATLELLSGWPLVSDPARVELLTPTGAAIIVTVAVPGSCPELTLQRVGYGVGSRDLADRPNLLRGLLGEAVPETGLERDRVTVIETHLDDSPPEWLGHLMERLLAAGALDVAYTPLQMKKNRPGVRVTVVAEPARAEALGRLLLRESSAIGVRFSSCTRLKLRRESGEVATVAGVVRVKLLYEGETLLRVTPEYASCHQLAVATGRPLPEIYRLAEQAAQDCFPT